jgi:hypothetical protein
MTECHLKERRECLPRHLAGPHGELAMADTTEAAHMSVDRKVVWRIGEDEIGAFVLKQAIQAVTVSGIAA